MNSRTFQNILALCFLLMAGGCANQPGRYRVDMVSDLIMMFPGADHKETQLDLTHTLVEKNASSTLVEVRIDSIQASMQSLSIKLAYDSTTDKGPIAPKDSDKQNRPEKYRQSFTTLQGTTYRALVNRQTGTVKLMDLPKRLNRIASGQVSGMFGGDQISMVLSRACLKDYAALGYLENLDQPWFLQGNTIVPGVASINTHRELNHEQKGTAPNTPHVTRVSFTFNESKKLTHQIKSVRATPTRKKSGMQLSSFEGQGSLLRDRGEGPILRWEEKATAHIQTSVRPKARTGTQKKNQQKIFYVIKRTIQQIER